MSNSPCELKKQISEGVDRLVRNNFRLYDSDYLEDSITIIIPVGGETAEVIGGVSDIIREKFPKHFYYPPNIYHFTILGRINPNLSKEKLLVSVKKLIAQYPLRLVISGITIKTNGICVLGFDLNENLEILRQKLREELGSGDVYANFGPIWEKVLWMNFMRFKEVPEARLVDFIGEYRGMDQEIPCDSKFVIYRTQSLILRPDVTEEIYCS